MFLAAPTPMLLLTASTPLLKNGRWLWSAWSWQSFASPPPEAGKHSLNTFTSLLAPLSSKHCQRKQVDAKHSGINLPTILGISVLFRLTYCRGAVLSLDPEMGDTVLYNCCSRTFRKQSSKSNAHFKLCWWWRAWGRVGKSSRYHVYGPFGGWLLYCCPPPYVLLLLPLLDQAI